MKKWMFLLAVGCIFLGVQQAKAKVQMEGNTKNIQAVKSEEKVVQARIIFWNHDTWEWVGEPVIVPNVKVGTVLNTEQYVPKGYTYVNEEFKHYTVLPVDMDYLDESGTTWTFNIHLNRQVISNKAQKQKGLTLDVARKYYKPSVIKAYIDQLSKASHSFLQLHFTDDHNFGIESDTLHLHPDTEGNAINPLNGKKFLTKAEVEKIVQYAKQKNVTVIPEIDTPSHMKAAIQLLKVNDPQTASSILLPESDAIAFNTIDYSKEASIQFVKNLYHEYFSLFHTQQEKYFHIGGDEFYELPQESNPSFVHFVNSLNQYVRQNGFTTRIWNDGFAKKDLSAFDKNMEITYWSLTGYQDLHKDDAKANLSKAYKADAEELLNHGFGVLNYNGYYTYLVAGDRTFTDEALNYTIHDLDVNWDIDNFELNDGNLVSNTGNILGSSMTIWGEEAQNYSDDQIYSLSSNMLDHFLQRVGE